MEGGRRGASKTRTEPVAKPSKPAPDRAVEAVDTPAEHDRHAPTARKTNKRRSRNPQQTVQDILKATVKCLATGGPEGVNLIQVAKLARVNRSTAYEYFQTREDLIARAGQWASDQLLSAVFGDATSHGESALDKVGKILGQRRVDELMATNERLLLFAMENSDLCRAWLMQVLSLDDPASDPFWRVLSETNSSLAKTELFQANVDPQILTVLTLAGAFLWPVSARAHAKSPEELQAETRRYVREFMRLMLFGVFRAEHFPELVTNLAPRRGKR
jgi:AcrR family transcriptional regulator